MKYILSSLLLFATLTFSLAQGHGRASIGGEVAFPTGSGTDGVGTGFGGSFRYELSTKNTKLNWLVSVGYLSFPINTSSSGATVSGSASFVPILFGIKFYPTESFKGFYFGSDIGVTLISEKINVSYMGFNGSGSGSDNKFTFSPGIGYHFHGADLGFRYNIISDANYFGVRLGIMLN
jgi:hypothetical protein